MRRDVLTESHDRDYERPRISRPDEFRERNRQIRIPNLISSKNNDRLFRINLFRREWFSGEEGVNLDVPSIK